MAEYSAVIKEAKRMCWHYTQGGNHDKCPMYPACNVSQCRKIAFERPADFEERVMAWAAEHPEPVYPTWGDWFAERGDLIKLWRNIKVCSAHGAGVIGFLYTTIPADIAQKLGIEPKEGV